MCCLANNSLKRLVYIWADNFLGMTRIDFKWNKENCKIKKGKNRVFTSWPIKKGQQQSQEPGKTEEMWEVGKKAQHNSKRWTWGGERASGNFLEVVCPYLSMGMVNDQNKLSIYCALMKHAASFLNDPPSSAKVCSHNCLL